MKRDRVYGVFGVSPRVSANCDEVSWYCHDLIAVAKAFCTLGEPPHPRPLSQFGRGVCEGRGEGRACNLKLET